MNPLLTRDFVATMIRDLTLDLTPEGKLKTALATDLLAAWDDRDTLENAYDETVSHCEQWIARAEAAEAKLAERDAEIARPRDDPHGL